MSSLLSIKNLSVKYRQIEVLKNISFTVEKGDFIGLAGPNGAGKTTLIKAILGLIQTSEGSVELFGKNKNKFTSWNKIGYLPQKFSALNIFFPTIVEEVVMLGLLSKKKFPKRITTYNYEKVDGILKKLGIINLKKRMFSELSGGQQQRVLLARALVSDPEILIFDEPSTALDAEARESFFELIQKMNKQDNISIILITHDANHIGKYASKLLYIDKNLIYFGKFSEFCLSKKMNSYFGKHEQHIICQQHN